MIKPAVIATQPRKAGCRSAIREQVGTALESRIERTLKLKTGKGCACSKLVDKMNGWRIAGCETNRALIVDTLITHRQELDVSFASAAFEFAKSMGVTDSLKLGVKLIGDLIDRKDVSHEAEVAGCNWLLDRAIEDVRSTLPVKPVVRATSSPKASTKLYDAMRAAPKPIADPFTGEPVFHFGGHLWPIVGCWEKHVDTWNKLAEQIAGRCFVGIAECEGCGTSPTSEVVARLSDRFETFTVPNTKDGENPTFNELLKRIPRGDNDVFLYAHGKGMKPATQISKAVKVWITVMYETVIFNHREIVRRMAQGYKAFGSLRAFGKMPLNPAHSWHYAGTFFAVRAKHLENASEVKKGYGGVEAWPGDNFPANEAWCEFGDNRNIMSHYSEKEMCSGAVEGAVEKLKSLYVDRYRHKNLIAVTTCNLRKSAKINLDIEVVLDSIAEHCVSDVVVVDDGSPVEYQNYVYELCRQKGFRFLPQPVNKGISEAKNVCLREFLDGCKYEYCFLLDDDVQVVSPEFESTYTKAIEKSGIEILSWNSPDVWGTFIDPIPVENQITEENGLFSTGHTCGCCVVVSRRCVEATGLYDVMPGKWGGEHSAYYQRAAKKGFAVHTQFHDVIGSGDVLKLVSHASVLTHEEKLASNVLNQEYLSRQVN